MGIFVVYYSCLPCPPKHTNVAHICCSESLKLPINLYSHNPSGRTRSLPIKRENTLNLLGSQENDF